MQQREEDDDHKRTRNGDSRSRYDGDERSGPTSRRHTTDSGDDEHDRNRRRRRDSPVKDRDGHHSRRYTTDSDEDTDRRSRRRISKRSPTPPVRDRRHQIEGEEFKDNRKSYRDHERRSYIPDEPPARGRFEDRNYPRSRRQDASDLASSDRRNNMDDGPRYSDRRNNMDDGHLGRTQNRRGDGYLGRTQSRRDSEQQELPELYSIHRATVRSVRPFGVFVRINGFYKQGLVHLSQLSDHEVTNREDSDEKKVQAIAAVAGENDEVWVKIISLKDEGGNVKIACSVKLVSQSTGQDLDPNNLKLEQQQTKGNRPELKTLTLDAIYNVVCSRCGGHGHLKTECYGTADKSYELLPDEDDELIEQPQQQMPQGHVLSRDTSNVPGYGRGRAMVLPAWMTNGSHQQIGREVKKKKKMSELPDSVTTVEEALALVAQMKKEKKEKNRRKDHCKHKKEKKIKK